jgi:hypothetical protein
MLGGKGLLSQTNPAPRGSVSSAGFSFVRTITPSGNGHLFHPSPAGYILPAVLDLENTAQGPARAIMAPMQALYHMLWISPCRPHWVGDTI